MCFYYQIPFSKNIFLFFLFSLIYLFVYFTLQYYIGFAIHWLAKIFLKYSSQYRVDLSLLNPYNFEFFHSLRVYSLIPFFFFFSEMIDLD